MRLISIIFILVGTTASLLGQDASPSNSYVLLDARSRAVRYDGNMERLAFWLTEGCATPTEKARALFIWVTENVGYDYKAFNRHPAPERFKCDDVADCREKQAKYERARVMRVLETGKDVCEGYALLYKELCGLAGIPCSVVHGYTKTQPTQIGRMGLLNHAWNVLRIDDRYVWVDCTWAAGFCPEDDEGKLTGFVKRFQEAYWLPPARRFFRDHFPEEEKWLEDSGVTKEDYRNGPYYYPLLSPNIEVVSPTTGTIVARLGETVSFRIRKDDYPVGGVEVNADPSYGGSYDRDWLPYEETDNVIECCFRIDNPRTRFIDVYLNGVPAVRFLVHLRK